MGVIAESEWRGGEQKKLEKLEFDMPIFIKNLFLILMKANSARVLRIVSLI